MIALVLLLFCLVLRADTLDDISNKLSVISTKLGNTGVLSQGIQSQTTTLQSVSSSVSGVGAALQSIEEATDETTQAILGLQADVERQTNEQRATNTILNRLEGTITGDSVSSGDYGGSPNPDEVGDGNLYDPAVNNHVPENYGNSSYTNPLIHGNQPVEGAQGMDLGDGSNMSYTDSETTFRGCKNAFLRNVVGRYVPIVFDGHDYHVNWERSVSNGQVAFSSVPFIKRFAPNGPVVVEEVSIPLSPDPIHYLESDYQNNPSYVPVRDEQVLQTISRTGSTTIKGITTAMLYVGFIFCTMKLLLV